jgi:asparagine synthase (glutamine-hydrolysing)
MSGFCGLWHLDGRPVDRDAVERLSATMAHRGPDDSGVWSSGAVGFACRLLRVAPEAVTERQPVADDDGNVLVFDGRLDNRDDLLAACSSADVSRHSPDSALVLAAWRTWGEAFPSRLQGDFSLALFDARRQTLILARDAIGCRPLYYWSDRNTFVFASEIKGILAHRDVRCEPNEDLIADFLLLDPLPYDDDGSTFFRHIQAVRPGHCVQVTAASVRQERFWDFDGRAQVRYPAYEDYAARLRELLIQAVRRRLRSSHPVAIAVSGGLDSSIVLCIADDLRRSGVLDVPLLPVSYTPEDPESEEDGFLRLLTSSRRLQIHRSGIGQPGPPDVLTLDAWHSEWPRADEGWCAQRLMLEHVRKEGARVLLTGHWSDQLLFVTGYLSDLVLRLRWRRVAAHLAEYAAWFADANPDYFAARFRRELFFNLTPHALRARVRPLRDRLRWRHADAASQLTVRTARRRPFVNRPRAATAHAGDIYRVIRSQSHRLQFEADDKLAAGWGIESLTPFLDRDVIAFLMSIPGEIQNRDGVPRALLRDAMRGIVPDPILRRRWRAAGLSSPAFARERHRGYSSSMTHAMKLDDPAGLLAAARAARVDAFDYMGMEFWSRAFFSDTLTGLRTHIPEVSTS